MTDDAAAHERGTVKLPPKIAAAVLLALVVALAAYLYLGYLLGVPSLFAGNLVLFYWAGIDHFELKALPAVILGSLGGIFNAALFALLPPVMGEAAGALVALFVLLTAIYFLLVKSAPILFNQPYMLLLTVTLIPSVAAEAHFVGMAVAVFYGGAFWGSTGLVAAWIRQRRAASAPS